MSSDTFRGLARGLTADYLGAPVDLATQAANLGIAGTGYLAHKLRLINQPPDLIDPANVPFSSDWHVKNSPLQDTGSAAYTAGRLTGNLAPGLRAFQTPKVKHGQTNALYPGGDDRLLLSHSTKPEHFTAGQDPQEFYHLSSAITKDRIPDDFGPVSFILNPKKFEPRTSPTHIANRDAWMPRADSSHAEGRYVKAIGGAKTRKEALENLIASFKQSLDDFGEDLQPHLPKLIKKLEAELATVGDAHAVDLRQEAVKRLSDRFLSYWPKGGRNAEGSSPTNRTFRDVNKGQGVIPNPDPIATDAHKVAIQQSPSFQSFRHYAKNPAGAKILTNDTDAPPAMTREVEGQIDDVLSELYTTNPNEIIRSWDKYKGAKKFELAKKLAALSNKEIEVGARSGNISKTAEDGVSIRPVTAEELRQYVTSMRENLRLLREAPSNYAEVKTFGATPINKETIAAIYVQPGQHKTVVEKLREYATKKGIPLIEGKEGRAYSDFAKVVQEQNRVMQRRP